MLSSLLQDACENAGAARRPALEKVPDEGIRSFICRPPLLAAGDCHYPALLTKHSLSRRFPPATRPGSLSRVSVTYRVTASQQCKHHVQHFQIICTRRERSIINKLSIDTDRILGGVNLTQRAQASSCRPAGRGISPHLQTLGSLSRDWTQALVKGCVSAGLQAEPL